MYDNTISHLYTTSQFIGNINIDNVNQSIKRNITDIASGNNLFPYSLTLRSVSWNSYVVKSETLGEFS